MVAGKVTVIRKDFLDGIVVVSRSGKPYVISSANCSFGKDFTDQVASLSKDNSSIADC